ncbi:protein-disulfide reductase DsbD N-terminal domain-containing protein [Mucilaginibacter sp.]|uniref:protein-disulfide reductase DsbD N-terminal domain-containing protein n=1 Tax=Mucilaginibacter sp. TaxID=1882438 RepID=UPI003D0CF32F
MKHLSIAAMLIFLTASAFAQIAQPVKWAYAAKKINDKEAVIFIKATIDDGWHIYSQNIKDGGPVKTSFTFSPAAGYSLIGKTIEPAPITHFEKSFGMDVSYFEKTVVFQQKIKLKKAQTTVKGSLEYMTCNDHKCLPPTDLDFSVTIK